MRTTSLVIAAAVSAGQGLAHIGHDGLDHEHTVEYGSATYNLFDTDKSAFEIVQSHLGFGLNFHDPIDPDDYAYLLEMTDPWGVMFDQYSQADIHTAYAYVLYALEKL